jgi:capsular exopolysaccharide synthesis family protein
MVCPLIHKDRGKFGFGESIRLLRIRTEKEMSKADKKVLIVSSAIPGEGKTTVSVNLAIALARNNKRVLLIDCDMYNPSVERALKPTIGKVLGSFTFGTTEKKANVHALTIRNLFTVLLTQGKGSDGRFLTSSDLRQLVQSSRKGFDYVILDTPPCSLLADTAEMAAAADCAVMVVRQDYAPRDKILDGARLLTDSGLPLIGCIMNGVTGTQHADGYNYGYGYGYGSRNS